MKMLNPKIAIFPGSFDPPTLGHYDIAVRAAGMFDEVYVVAFVNAAKKGRFGFDARREMLSVSFAGVPNIRTDVSEELLADYCLAHGIGTIVKGARNAADFDYELSLSMINRSIERELDTVILPTKNEYLHVSSTFVYELIRYGRDYAAYLPFGAAAVVEKTLGNS